MARAARERRSGGRRRLRRFVSHTTRAKSSPTLLAFGQPFGIIATVGLIALSGILMRNTLILIGQIRHNEQDGMMAFDAVIEATVQRSRPATLAALAIPAFIPPTYSVLWGTLAYPLFRGTFGGAIPTLMFLPALYAIWFKADAVPGHHHTAPAVSSTAVPVLATRDSKQLTFGP